MPISPGARWKHRGRWTSSPDDAEDELQSQSRRNATFGGVHLVVVPIDYTENSRVLIDELRENLKKVADPMVCIAPE
jgi:hypothetical protein